MAGGSNFLGGVFCCSDIPFHIGLTRTKPDLSDQDVLQFNLVFSFDSERQAFAIGFSGRKFDLPIALVVGFRRGSGSVKVNRNFLTSRSRPPKS